MLKVWGPTVVYPYRTLLNSSLSLPPHLVFAPPSHRLKRQPNGFGVDEFLGIRIFKIAERRFLELKNILSLDAINRPVIGLELGKHIIVPNPKKRAARYWIYG